MVARRLCINPTSAGVWVSPACMEFYLNNRRRTPEPPLCKGRCRVKRGGGIVPCINYLLCSANSQILQSLRRFRASSLYTREPFLVCANIAHECFWANIPAVICLFCKGFRGGSGEPFAKAPHPLCRDAQILMQKCRRRAQAYFIRQARRRCLCAKDARHFNWWMCQIRSAYSLILRSAAK